VPPRAAQDGPIWTRPTAPPTRSTLTREAIVEAAVAIADEQGLDAVTIRSVAVALDARPMSLYPRIGSKDDLVDLMVDHVAGEVLLDAVPEDWRTALREIAEHTRAAGLRHPWLTTMFGRRLSFGPNALRHVEQSLAAVSSLGLPDVTARALLVALDTFTMGHLTTELSLDGIGLPDPDAWRVAVATYLEETASSGALPHLAARGTAVVLADVDHDAVFDAGLTWLLDGFAGSLPR
jgi:AcrR family transcriptional regulator